eukprot:4701336-Prymnesium_polylepis.1
MEKQREKARAPAAGGGIVRRSRRQGGGGALSRARANMPCSGTSASATLWIDRETARACRRRPSALRTERAPTRCRPGRAHSQVSPRKMAVMNSKSSRFSSPLTYAFNDSRNTLPLIA